MELLVEGFPASANNPGRVREHFLYLHWKSKVEILQEGLEPLPRCDQCGMHMRAARMIKYRRTDKCNKAMERRIRWKDVEMTARCGEMEFIMYG